MAYQSVNNTRHDNGLHPDIQSNQPGLEVKIEQSPQLVQEHVYPQATHEYHPPNGHGYQQDGARRGQELLLSSNSKADHEDPSRRAAGAKRRVLGLALPIFWAIVIGLVLIATGAIAGGVAGGLSAQRRDSSSSSAGTASTATSSSGASSPTAASASKTTGSGTSTATRTATGSASPSPTDGGCPAINGTTYTPLNSTGGAISMTSEGSVMSFVEVCDTNWPAGEGNGNAGVADIMSLYLPSLEDCMTACAQYNVGHAANGGDGAGYCGAVAILKADGGNCYLKNSSTGNNETFGYPKAYSMGVLISGS